MIIHEINKHIFYEYGQSKINKSLRAYNVFWPSQASAKLKDDTIVGNCLRQSFYNIRKIPATNLPSVSKIRKMAYGNVIEAYELDKGKSAGIVVDQAVPFKLAINDHLTVSGKLDGISLIDGVYKCLEYKTSAGYSFKKQIWGTETECGFPRWSHLMQVMLYLDGFKDHKQYPFDTAVIIYIDRESCLTTEFEVKMNDGFPVLDGELVESINLKSIYERYEELHEYLIKNILPPCDYKPFYTIQEGAVLLKENKITKQSFYYAKKQGYGRDMLCSFCEWSAQCQKDNHNF